VSKRILITGGAGFIGTNLINDLLNRGYDASNIAFLDNYAHGSFLEGVHDKVTEYKVDIRDRTELKNVFEQFKPDTVYHFAGLVSIYDCDKGPIKCFDNNVMGSINVFDLCVEYNSRIIFSETSAVYENCEGLPYNESQSDPTTVYSTSKACVALIAESYSRTRNLKYTALRYFNVAGPLQDYARTVPPLFAGVAVRIMGKHQPIIFGDGNRRRDFIHVDDVNAFHLLCLEDDRTENQTYNLGTGKSTSLFEIIDIAADILKPDLEVSHLAFPEINGEAFEIVADISKAKSLGWEPKKSIKEAIEDTIIFLKDEIVKGNVNPNTFMEDLNPEDVKIG
jgi:UDP-glucose 4-epimerase